MHKAVDSILSTHKLGTVVSSQKVQNQKSKTHPQLYTFEASLGFMRPGLEQLKAETKQRSPDNVHVLGFPSQLLLCFLSGMALETSYYWSSSPGCPSDF